MWFGIGIVIALICIVGFMTYSSSGNAKMSPRQQEQSTSYSALSAVVFIIVAFFLGAAMMLGKK